VRHFVTIVILFFSCSAWAQAQAKEENNQLGLLLGAEFITDNSTAAIPSVPVNIGNSEVFQLNFAHRLAGAHTQLWLEIPAAAGPSHSVRSADLNTPISLATFYATPSFRVNFAAQRPLSPWLSFGGGYALFQGSDKLRNGLANPDLFTNTGALQFGGGVDIRTPLKILKPIGFRGEVRDFYSIDTPRFITPVRDDHQHNVIVSGGFILRF
jgi:hypothetical protein